MSDFVHHKPIGDRAATDRRRHRAKIEEAIKRGVTDVVAEESIIGQDGKKKIRIPVRGIKEYRFVYGDNETNQKVGSAPGSDLQRGQKIGDDPNEKQQGADAKPGDEPGEEYYEVEVTLAELTEYIFADLKLPDLERKKLRTVTGEKFRRHGYRKSGIRPRLDKKRSLKQLIRRRVATKRCDDTEEDIGFHENDLRYRHIKVKEREASSAVIFFLMDISGSMSTQKKYLARSFYFLLYHFLRGRYEHVEIVFVAHDTSAYEVNEEQFFKRGHSGGTLVSSGLEKVLDIIDKRFHPSSWNIYCFQCSDGDNFDSDTPKARLAIEKLYELCQLFGYCEICPEEESVWRSERQSTLWDTYESFVAKGFKMVNITDKTGIWPAFKRLFGGTKQGSFK